MKWFTRFFLSLAFILFSGNTYLEAYSFRIGTKSVLSKDVENIFLSQSQQENLPSNFDYTLPYRQVQDLPEFADENLDEEDEEPFSGKKSLRSQSGYFVQAHNYSALRSNSIFHKERLYPEQLSSLISHRHILFQVFRI